MRSATFWTCTIGKVLVVLGKSRAGCERISCTAWMYDATAECRWFIEALKLGKFEQHAHNCEHQDIMLVFIMIFMCAFFIEVEGVCVCVVCNLVRKCF